MYVVLERREEGVLCVDLHASRPWLLLGLRNGQVQIWDWERNQPELEQRSHKSPIRSVAWHPRLSGVYLTGGADTNIKIWNRDRRNRCQAVLRGHDDYIRYAVFHPVYPWVISASDDCTIRFWNWINKEHLTTVTGHIHWVTILDLHPTQDFLLSASVDNTVRVWNYSSLRNRVSNRGEHLSISHLFGTLDVVVHHTFEELRGRPGLALFHPTLPLVCVGDGKVVRVYSLTFLSEVHVLVGHHAPVTGGVFYPDVQSSDSRFFLLTCSKDSTVKSWDLKRGLCVESISVEKGALFGVVRHPGRQLFCLLTLTGLALVKLWRERPIFTVYKHHLYYIREGVLRYLNMERKTETQLIKLAGVKNISLSYNPDRHSILRNYFRSLVPSYQILDLVDAPSFASASNAKTTPGEWATWVSTNRFCHVEGIDKLVVKNCQNQNVNFAGFAAGFLVAKSSSGGENAAGLPRCHRIFAGCMSSHVLLYEDDRLVHYDLQKRRRLATISLPGLKSTLWNHTGSHLALWGRRWIQICDRGLKRCGSHRLRDTKVKSATWCETSGALIFTTNKQMRFLLRDGEEGAVCSLPEPCYLARLQGGQALLLSRAHRWRTMDINPAEFHFKAAVLNGDEAQLSALVSSGRILGQAQLTFLTRANRADIAIHFIHDPGARLSLALQLNNLPAALEAATTLGDLGAWQQLATSALLNGQLRLAETAYQRAQAYTQLQLLYLITGQLDKLRQLGQQLASEQAWSNCYSTCLLLGDSVGQLAVLEQAGQPALARLLRLASDQPTGGLRRPPLPVCKDEGNWPQVDSPPPRSDPGQN